MKVLTIFLAIIISFCAIKPGVEVFSLAQGETVSCCSGQCTPITGSDSAPTDTTDQEQESHKVCNPFLACCACVVTYNEVFTLAPNIVAHSTREVFAYTSQFSSYLSFEFWNPPKFLA